MHEEPSQRNHPYPSYQGGNSANCELLRFYGFWCDYLFTINQIASEHDEHEVGHNDQYDTGGTAQVLVVILEERGAPMILLAVPDAELHTGGGFFLEVALLLSFLLLFLLLLMLLLALDLSLSLFKLVVHQSLKPFALCVNPCIPLSIHLLRCHTGLFHDPLLSPCTYSSIVENLNNVILLFLILCDLLFLERLLFLGGEFFGLEIGLLLKLISHGFLICA